MSRLLAFLRRLLGRPARKPRRKASGAKTGSVRTGKRRTSGAVANGNTAKSNAAKPRTPRSTKTRAAPLKPLYARLTGPEVLAHNARAALVKEIRREPGQTLQALAKRLDLASTTVAWHARTLEREGFLVSLEEGRTRRFFPPGTPKGDRRRQSVLLDESRRRLVDVVRDHPGVTQERLADLLDLSRSTVWHHARRLETEGLLRSRKEGRERRYFSA